MESWLESFARANFLRSSDTAHDLKTPLNVAVLNLELLRMRMRKLAGDDDEKLSGYARAIELELRRMARIFDTFFLLSTPPKNEGEPQDVDVAPIVADVASAAGHDVTVAGPLRIRGHESRIRQALKMFFDGAANVLRPDGRRIEASRDGSFSMVATGVPEGEDFELTKIFKFYYTDSHGNPDLSLAAARLIAETYGGELSASVDRDKVSISLVFPLGEE
jgi:nitrogen fixation/metabolism regulation signal transduction histidine kinase